ncbi:MULTISPECIES: phage tail assembly chaperone [unclassified Pseudomonas]|uniref:phage tail assembly chaperone n=1 Tax=unclassified Pseudomonas TaxID=196821 RepID=UPI000A1E83AC|nr:MULTISPECIES: phage tail assembly chaperone [unclassified Pseudomonas]MDI2141745.1 hypothetical protein [Pseudomonas sp. ITA]
MKAIIENGEVTALVTGDVDCGIAVPVSLPVSTGWLYDNERFSAPPQVDAASDVQAEAQRQWRTKELTGTDWLVTRHRDELDVGAQPSLSSKQFSKLQAYRQALRDLPASSPTLDDSARPQPPKWLARLS